MLVPMDCALATYRSIEHLTGYTVKSWPEEVDPALDDRDSTRDFTTRIQALAAATRRAGTWNCPTLYNSTLNGHSSRHLSLSQQLVKALQEAGAGLLLGSDRLQSPREKKTLDGVGADLTPERRRLEAVYGDASATHRELEALVKAGLTPYQALATGTRNVAAFFGTLDSTGTIEVGKRADLVLPAGNPLADIRQTTRIAGVMLGGRWLDRAELDRRTADLAAWVKRRCSSAASTAGQLPCP